MNRTLLLVLPLLALGAADLAAQRTLDFSGYEWLIRRSDGPEGPGPNVFLDNRRTVWVDEEGALHLRIWNRDRAWYTAEVRLQESLGYGTYHFTTAGTLRFESPEVILGLFLYDHDAPDEFFREIDIEYGRFGNPAAPEAQFAVQPFDAPGNRHAFMLPGEKALEPDQVMTHAFRWTAGELVFRVALGDHRDLFVLADDDPRMVSGWVLSGDAVPEPGTETVHINLWLYQGDRPAVEHEVVIASFRFDR